MQTFILLNILGILSQLADNPLIFNATLLSTLEFWGYLNNVQTCGDQSWVEFLQMDKELWVT